MTPKADERRHNICRSWHPTNKLDAKLRRPEHTEGNITRRWMGSEIGKEQKWVDMSERCMKGHEKEGGRWEREREGEREGGRGIHKEGT